MRSAYEAGEPAQLGYQVVFVSRDASSEAAASYAAEERMPWAYLPPAAGGRAQEVAVLSGRSVPDMVVVDSKGRVLCRAYGPDGRYRGVSQVFDALRRDLRSKPR
jgi:hypothetical protein